MSDDSTPPEVAADEPIAALPTRETARVWAETEPVVPAEDSADAVDPQATADEALPPPLPSGKGDPDWAEPESSTDGEPGNKSPEWAQTVPTSPGEAFAEVEEASPEPEAEPAEKKARWSDAVASEPPAPAAAEEAATEEVTAEEPAAEVTATPLTDPPKAVAADALKSTWPPRAESPPAPPEETDIWPPEPPTERAMPAWPPPSELEEPATPAQAIPSWPDSFDSTPAAPVAHITPPPVAASTPPTITPAPEVSAPAAPARQVTQPAGPPPPPAPPARPAPVPAPQIETAPPTEPETIPGVQQVPVAPAQAGPPSRPTWAPTQTAAEAGPAAPREQQPARLQVPAWAPRVPLAAEPGTPTWFSPKEQIPHATAQPAAHPAPQPPSAPAPPTAGGQLPVAQIPPAPAAPTQPATAKPTWQVVEQARAAKGPQGPTAEDRSYAEWFAWAKRGGAPASACHAAAQGAFKALASGKDVTTAVQWATAAMSRPPENVAYGRQTYCAWFALANIDLNLDQHRSHAFAGAAVQALDAGQDAGAAHAAGLAAAGIR